MAFSRNGRSGLCALVLLGAAVAGPGWCGDTEGRGTQWGDLGNGSYRNPVLPADYSDLDAIRVPHRYRDIVEPLSPEAERTYMKRQEPRFAATINFGRRFEPWIVDLQPTQPIEP